MKRHPRAVPINITGEILLRYGTLEEMSARIVMSIAATFAFANPAFAQNWNGLAAISNTLELYADRLCVGADPSLTLGCPTYAPNLDASGNISTTGHISATAYYGDGSALTGISANTDRIVSGSTNIIANTTGSISFTTAGTTAMVISGSNVGIGTTAPSSTLHVVGRLSGKSNSTAWGAIFGGWGGNGSVAIGNHGDVATIQGASDLSATSVAPLALNHIGGNVGIGTTAPGTRLEIKQSADTSTGGLRVTNSSGNRATYLWSDGSNNGRLDSGATGTGNLVVNSGGGNVGIGTTSPAKTLHVSGTTHITSTTTVSGTIHATEIKVSNAEQPCNAASVGTLRWNAAKRRPEMCFPDTP